MTWKRISLWAGAAIITLATCAAIIVAVLVKQSPSFRQGLLARAESNLYETTGARIAVRDFSLDFFPLNLTLYGVVVRGSEPQFGEPLLRADYVGAGIEMRSLLGRKWSLREVVIDHPVVHLFVNQAGETNLPQPETNSRSKASVFDLSLRELRLHDAEVDCNEKKLLLDGNWNNLHAAIDFDSSAKQYRGIVHYAEGKVKYGQYPPLVHSLDLSLYAGATKVTVDHLALFSGKSRITVTGSVEDYSHPAVQATYDAHIATSDAGPFLKNISLPTAGVVDVAGTVNYRRDPNHPVLEVIARAEK